MLPIFFEEFLYPRGANVYSNRKPMRILTTDNSLSRSFFISSKTIPCYKGIFPYIEANEARRRKVKVYKTIDGLNHNFKEKKELFYGIEATGTKDTRRK